MLGPRSHPRPIVAWLLLVTAVGFLATRVPESSRAVSAVPPVSARVVTTDVERSPQRSDLDLAFAEGPTLAEGRGRSLGLVMGLLIGLGLWLTRRRLRD